MLTLEHDRDADVGPGSDAAIATDVGHGILGLAGEGAGAATNALRHRQCVTRKRHKVGERAQIVTFDLDPQDGRTRAQIASQGRIVDERIDARGRLEIRAEMTIDAVSRLRAHVADPEKLAAE